LCKRTVDEPGELVVVDEIIALGRRRLHRLGVVVHAHVHQDVLELVLV